MKRFTHVTLCYLYHWTQDMYNMHFPKHAKIICKMLMITFSTKQPFNRETVTLLHTVIIHTRYLLSKKYPRIKIYTRCANTSSRFTSSTCRVRFKQLFYWYQLKRKIKLKCNPNLLNPFTHRSRPGWKLHSPELSTGSLYCMVAVSQACNTRYLRIAV